MFDIFDVIAFLVLVVGIVFSIRFFIINPYSVSGESMSPTLSNKDFIMVDKISPHISTYERNDVIVFVPEYWTLPFIKRIVWLPWEHISIKDGEVFICEDKETNCVIYEQEYLQDTYTSTTQCWLSEFDIPEDGWYFVLWDNRNNSTDSRCCFWYGCFQDATYLIPPDRIIWRAMMRVFPSPTML